MSSMLRSHLAILWLCSLYSNHGFVTWIQPNFPLSGERAAPGTPWPLPNNWIKSPQFYTLEPKNFRIKSNVRNCDVLEHNVKTYRKYFFLSDGEKAENGIESIPQLKGLILNILSGHCEKQIKPDSNETYFIEIKKDDPYGQLKSNTIWGALRALETFSQLIWKDEYGQYLVNFTKIADFPRFSHRGIMLDSARHYLHKTIILRNLDAMQWNKMNVFHWHLTDDQSFPFESQIFPNLTELGAYQLSLVYTKGDIAEILEYARLRAIRIIPEFDSPGHTRAIGNAFKNLLTPCYGNGTHPFTPKYPEFSEMENFNPIIEDVYSFMKRLIVEIKAVFPDPYIHLGMDEVNYGCWESNPEISEFMEKKDMIEYSELENYYSSRLIKIVSDLGYKYIAWQDPIDNEVPLAVDTLIQVWKDDSLHESLKSWKQYIWPIANKGYKILMSACWYFNNFNYGPDWKACYECDPQDFEGTEGEKNLVVGGEAVLVGEYVDGTNLLPRLWPRASAVAEKLWSRADSTKDTDSATFRLDQHRCRMSRRGIPAEPILNGYCGNVEWGLRDNSTIIS